MYNVDFYLQQQRQHVTTETEARTACSVGHARGELGQVSMSVLHPEYGVHIYLAVLGILRGGCDERVPKNPIQVTWLGPSCGEGKETADNNWEVGTGEVGKLGPVVTRHS